MVTAWWTGEVPDPEPPYSPVVVQAIAEALMTAPVDRLGEVFESPGWRDHEFRAALGIAVEDLNWRLRYAGWDAADGRRRELAARVAELQRLTGSDGAVAYPDQ